MGPRLLGTFVGKRVTHARLHRLGLRQQVRPGDAPDGRVDASGTHQVREDIVEGIDKAPRAFIGLLRGENFGKLQVKLGPEPGKG